MSASNRPPVVYDGVEIDPDWLDEQVANYIPGCMDKAVRMLRAFERTERRAAQSKADAA